MKTIRKLPSVKNFKKRNFAGKWKAFEDALFVIKHQQNIYREYLSEKWQRQNRRYQRYLERYEKQRRERELVSGFLKNAPLYWEIKQENEQLKKELEKLKNDYGVP